MTLAIKKTKEKIHRKPSDKFNNRVPKTLMSESFAADIVKLDSLLQDEIKDFGITETSDPESIKKSSLVSGSWIKRRRDVVRDKSYQQLDLVWGQGKCARLTTLRCLLTIILMIPTQT